MPWMSWMSWISRMSWMDVVFDQRRLSGFCVAAELFARETGRFRIAVVPPKAVLEDRHGHLARNRTN